MCVLHTRERLCVTGESAQHTEGLFKVSAQHKEGLFKVSVAKGSVCGSEACVSEARGSLYLQRPYVKTGCRECVKEGPRRECVLQMCCRPHRRCEIVDFTEAGEILKKNQTCVKKERECVCVCGKRFKRYPFRSQSPCGGVNLTDTFKLAGLVKAATSPPVIHTRSARVSCTSVCVYVSA